MKSEDKTVLRVVPWTNLSHVLQGAVLEAPEASDKSLTHRAVMLAAMASGTSVILHPLEGEDCLSTRKAFESLGVSFQSMVQEDGTTQWTVHSEGMDAWQNKILSQDVDLGNSGTSARLLTGLFAGIPGLSLRLTGDSSLSRRPMERILEPLRLMNGNFGAEKTLPLTITGSILKINSLETKKSSAQIKSGILFAALSARGETRVRLPSGSRDHTEKVFEWLGASIRRRSYNGFEEISFVGPWRPRSFKIEIPNDPSSAAFWAALGALHGDVKVRCRRVMYNKTRIGFFDLLTRMGCHVHWDFSPYEHRSSSESFGDVTIFRPLNQPLKSIHVLAQEIPSMIDEIPILSILCAFANGTSTIEGLEELRVKESDRLSEIHDLLQRAGCKNEMTRDSLSIFGGDFAKGFEFEGDDHRMLMSAAVLATKCQTESVIHGTEWIATSFPKFLECFQRVSRLVENSVSN